MDSRIIATGEVTAGDELINFELQPAGHLFELLASGLPLQASGAEGILREKLLTAASLEKRNALKAELGSKVNVQLAQSKKIELSNKLSRLLEA